MVASAQDLLECRYALKCFVDTIFQEISHPQEPRLPPDGLGWLSTKRHLPQARIHLQQLKDAEPATVACVMAIVTAATSHKRRVSGALGGQASGVELRGRRFVGGLALCTNDPYESLGHDGNYAGGDQERRHLHYIEADSHGRRWNLVDTSREDPRC